MRKLFLLVVMLILTVAATLALSSSSRGAPARTSGESLAQCLSKKGAKFYGTWWCHWCGKQKKAFGNDAKDLPYIECSSPGKHDRLPVCAEAGIDAYPTWIFPNGPTVDGYVDDLKVLAKISGCPL